VNPVRARLILGAYQGGSELARRIPGSVAADLATVIGTAVGRMPSAQRSMVARHQLRAQPGLTPRQLQHRIDRAYASYLRYWLESFALPHLDPITLTRGLTTEGYERYVLPALEGGSGVILALPHLGGWEWAGRWLADRGHRVTAVVERVEPPELFDWFVNLRTDLGMNIVPLDTGAGKEVLSALKNNEVVCLLSDRDLHRNGVEVDFFGERTTLPAGPATLGIRTGAPILPTAVYFSGSRGSHHLGVVRPPLDTQRSGVSLRSDVARVTQALADELSGLIRRDPSQWHLFQPNWPSDPGFRLSSQ
jgi:phosphatidylinositol dimannoside acyltransferase